MSASESFFEAAAQEPFTILGQVLYPLSLGHRILLKKFRSPFLLGGDCGLSDLAIGVLVCSMDWRGFHQFFRENPKGLESYIRQVAKIKRNDAELRLKLFADYIEYGSRAPKVFVKEENGAATAYGSPDEQVVRVALMMRLHNSEESILNRPWSLCMWDLFTIGEFDGRSKLCDPDEYKSMRDKANEFAKAVAEGRVKHN